MEHRAKFVITRRDLRNDPVTIVAETLFIGGAPECGLLLNDPTISLVHCGIRMVSGNYYLFALKPANSIQLNGQAVESNQVLASGDILNVGPYSLRLSRNSGMLNIEVSHLIEITPERDEHESTVPLKNTVSKPRLAPLQGDKALDFYWDVRIREAGKLINLGSLFPKSERSSGKAYFNWKGTSDLFDRTSLPLFVWSAILGALLLIVWAYS